jgi:anaerobic selenocysteine-containing dehydrogenase
LARTFRLGVQNRADMAAGDALDGRRSAALPLPKGEGRGEGEQHDQFHGDASLLDASFICWRFPMNSTLPRENTLLRRWQGPLTADLTLRPGDFGLGRVPERLAPDATTTMVCGFCSTGCGLKVHLRNGQAVNLSPADDHPVNLGMACPKGWEALTPLAAPDRATAPLLRDASGALKPVDWDHALQVFTLKFKALLDQHGPESIAFLSTGQICTEEMAFLGALFKFGMGGVHGDSNTRQCMATSAVAYKQSFGFDAPPYTYADFEESDVLVFIGSNLCIAHPIMWQRVLRNRHNPEIIVIDPRATETAMCATQHLALRPKSDLTLLYGIAHLLIANGWIDRRFIDAHTSGFEAFAEFVLPFTPVRVAEATGLSAGQLHRFAEKIARGRAVSFWWTMGVNQGHESTRTAQAIINLALMTGNIGRPGTGANSITGQCNAMGSRLFGNTTNLLGGRDFTSADDRETVARLTGIPVARIPARNSLAYDQILDAVDAGRIKGLWIIATNTAHSWIGKGRLGELLGKLEFLVVQDLFATTDTARHAHLFLPAAGWGEKEGTLINSERRIGLVKKVSRAPGEALADFHIFQLLAHYWGCGELFREWTSPEAVFQIMKRLSAGQPCDFTGIADYRMLDEQGGIQWPWAVDENNALMDSGASFPLTPALSLGERGQHSAASGKNGALSATDAAGKQTQRADEAGAAEVSEDQSETLPLPKGEGWGEGKGAVQSSDSVSDGTEASRIPARERRLFADGRFHTPDGRARFLFDAPRPAPDAVDAEFPMVLLTGRGTSAQWHTNTRTGKSDVLRRLYPANIYVELNARDAERLGIGAGETVEVASRRAVITATAFITPAVSPGQVFIPMHYDAVNLLTAPAFDPHSRQPSYKHCAVCVGPVSARRKALIETRTLKHEPVARS